MDQTIFLQTISHIQDGVMSHINHMSFFQGTPLVFVGWYPNFGVMVTSRPAIFLGLGAAREAKRGLVFFKSLNMHYLQFPPSM